MPSEKHEIFVLSIEIIRAGARSPVGVVKMVDKSETTSYYTELLQFNVH